MSPKFFPKRRVVAVNGSAGAFVSISPTLPFCRKMEITECPPGSGTFTNASPNDYQPQGLNYQLVDDNFVATIALVPADTLRFGDDVAQGTGLGRALGGVAYTDASGTAVTTNVLVKLRSATVTATQVEVREWI